MSDDREKKAIRRSRTTVAIERQQRIATAAGITHLHNQPHRYAKMHSLNCGDPNCHMCGNPRKFFNEPTMQEKKFIEGNKYTQNDCTDSE